MKKILLLIFFFLFSIFNCQAQDQHNKDSLFTALKTAKEDTNKVKLLYEYAYTMNESKKDSFFFYMYEALALSKKTDFKKSTVMIYGAIAEYHELNSTHDSAIFYTMNQLTVAKQLNDSLIIGWAFCDLSYFMLSESGNLDKRLMYLDSAISYALNNKDILVEAFSRKSEIYLNQNKTDEAKYFLQKAINLYPNVDMDFNLLMHFSEILKKTGRADSALTIYNSLLERDKLKPSMRIDQKSYLYAIIAHTYLQLKNYKLAVASGETGLKIAVDNNLTKERLDNLRLLYQIYYAKKDYEKALDYYKQNREFNDSLNAYTLKSRETSYQNQLKADKNQQQLLFLEKENEQQRFVRNVFIGGILAILFIAFILFINYKKQRTLNKQLDETNHSLIETQQQLIASERLAAFGSVATRMAHEIQNPLNFVNNFSELSEELIEEIISATSEEEKNDAAKTLTENLQKINHHGKRAAEIVKQLQEHTNKGTAQEYFEAPKPPKGS